MERNGLGSTPTSQARIAKILLVDDRADLLAPTAEMLREQGFAVRATTDPRQAERWAGEDEALDYLVTDYEMPGMDGVELARRIRQRHPRLGIVFVSSATEDPRLAQRAQRGDVCLLLKPFGSSELAACLEEAGGRARLAVHDPDAAPLPYAGSPLEVPSESASEILPPAGSGRRGAWPGAQRRWWASVAAAVLLLVVGLQLWGGRPEAPPALPDLAADSVTRSARLELESPLGAQSVHPDYFGWRPVPGAQSYRVVCVGVDGEVIWSEETPVAVLEWTPELLSTLRPAVTYRWWVEALGEAAEILARSSQAEFTLALNGSAE